MQTSKRFLHIAMGISAIFLSLALLIFSIRTNTANAQQPLSRGYIPAGIHPDGENVGFVVGYNPQTGDAKIIAHYHP